MLLRSFYLITLVLLVGIAAFGMEDETTGPPKPDPASTVKRKGSAALERYNSAVDLSKAPLPKNEPLLVVRKLSTDLPVMKRLERAMSGTFTAADRVESVPSAEAKAFSVFKLTLLVQNRLAKDWADRRYVGAKSEIENLLIRVNQGYAIAVESDLNAQDEYKKETELAQVSARNERVFLKQLYARYQELHIFSLGELNDTIFNPWVTLEAKAISEGRAEVLPSISEEAVSERVRILTEIVDIFQAAIHMVDPEKEFMEKYTKVGNQLLWNTYRVEPFKLKTREVPAHYGIRIEAVNDKTDLFALAYLPYSQEDYLELCDWGIATPKAYH